MRSDELLLDMAPYLEKLQNLERHLPHPDPVLCAFGRFVASRLNHEHVPAGFDIVCGQAILAIVMRNHGVPPELQNLPEETIDRLNKSVATIAAAVFPQEFALQVAEFEAEVSGNPLEKQTAQLTRRLLTRFV